MRKIEAITIGASAGGVHAMLKLLSAVPSGFQVPILIVLHVPAHTSALSEVFGRSCALPVKEAEDKEPIAAARVYIAPPDYHLLVEPDKTLALSQDDPVLFSRPSIDLLFESAAYAYRENLLGIVLTGASSDGAAGLKVIRDFGGQAWVQDPEDADTPIMPAAAIAQAGADEILTLDAIAARWRDINEF